MVVCSMCEKDIPKPRRCAHGKLPKNCVGPCMTAYVGEHEATCEGKKTKDNDGKVEKAGEGFDEIKTAISGRKISEDAKTLETTAGHQDAALTVAYSRYVREAAIEMVRALRQMEELPNCFNCNKTKEEANVPKIRKCTRCNLVGYCGKQCQQKHWKMKHKEECETLKEIAKRLRAMEG